MPARGAIAGWISSPRALAAVVVVAVCLAVVFAVCAADLRFWALWADGPHAGMFGAAAADVRVTPEERAENQAEAEALRGRARIFDGSAMALLLVALVGTVVAGWRARRDVRRWHWPSILGLPALVVSFLLEGNVGTCRPTILAFMAFQLVIGAGAAFDLSRKRIGTPGRVVAWATALLALAALAFSIQAASTSSGIVGRWLAGYPPC